jgi:four helix bundle protein
MKVEMFEDLEVWQKGRELVNKVYDLVRDEPFCRDYALRDQILKAAISVPSNIAEGFERQSDQEFIRFLYIAKGSAGEVRSQLHHALDQNYISEKVFEASRGGCLLLSKQISTFIQYLESTKRTMRK